MSVDKITKFSVRPPELRHVIRTPGNYYRWFFVKNDRIGREQLETVLDLSMNSSVWVDGLQNQVFVRVKAFKEISEHLDSLDIGQDMETPIVMMKEFLKNIIELYNQFNDCGDCLGEMGMINGVS